MYEFDFKTLSLTIKNSRKILLRNCGIAFIVGAVIAFSIPKLYSSSCMLAPESQEEGMSGGLSNLASMAGINLGGGMDAIGPDLYPDVVSSNDFLVNMLYVNVETLDGEKMQYLDYLKNKTRTPWWYFIKRGFSMLMKAINPQPVFTTSAGEGERINPERMSREDEVIINGLKGSISCSVSDLDNTINIKAYAQDPLVAKQIVDSAMVHLQDFVIYYRTNKARVDLEYYMQLQEELKAQYDKAQAAYAEHCDSHMSTVLQVYESKRDALENDVAIALNAYTQVKQQVQMAEAKVQEKTPAFTVIQKASVANKHDSPRKILLVFSCIFVTLLFTLGWIYVKLLFFTKKD